jgi:L-asparaginase/Glu-tRNA(Gln) amidotransferase subunit D
VVRSSRCAFGALVGSAADQLLQASGQGAVPAGAGAGALSPVQARIELMLALVKHSLRSS